MPRAASRLLNSSREIPASSAPRPKEISSCTKSKSASSALSSGCSVSRLRRRHSVSWSGYRKDGVQPRDRPYQAVSFSNPYHRRCYCPILLRSILAIAERRKRHHCVPGRHNQTGCLAQSTRNCSRTRAGLTGNQCYNRINFPSYPPLALLYAASTRSRATA